MKQYPSNVRFQAQLGRAYMVDDLTSEGMKYLAPLVEAKNPTALHTVGVRYLLGSDGFAKDYLMARQMFDAAAEQKHLGAFYELSKIYKDGLGVPIDLGKHFENLRNCSEAAYSFHWCQHNLAYAYRDGLGVAKSDQLAVKWWLKAAAQTNRWANYELGVMYEKGTGVAKDLQKAREFYLAAYEFKTDWSAVALTRLYRDGLGVAKNKATAIKYYEDAIMFGNGNRVAAVAETELNALKAEK